MPQKYQVICISDAEEYQMIRYKGKWWEKYQIEKDISMIFHHVTEEFLSVNSKTHVGIAV